MPVDTSSYALARLRLDGRRWNELRRIHGQVSTQAAADGSSYLEMGNTKVICTVNGPREQTKGGGGSSSSGRDQSKDAKVEVEISIAGFSGVDRKKRSRTDKRTQEMQHTLASTFASTLLTHLYPHSTIAVALHVLAQDGGVLAACLNAASLALVDAGIPMRDYVAACTAGSTAAYTANDAAADPLLDLSSLEEAELPFLTLATCGPNDRVGALVLETRVQAARVEPMLAVGLDGCRQVRGVLDGIVRLHGRRLVEGKLG